MIWHYQICLALWNSQMLLFFTDMEFAVQGALIWEQPSGLNHPLPFYFKVFMELILFVYYELSNVKYWHQNFQNEVHVLTFIRTYLKSDPAFHWAARRSFSPSLCKHWWIYCSFWCPCWFSDISLLPEHKSHYHTIPKAASRKSAPWGISVRDILKQFCVVIYSPRWIRFQINSQGMTNAFWSLDVW